MIKAKPAIIEKTKPISKTEAEAEGKVETKVKTKGEGGGKVKTTTKGKEEGEVKTETKTKTKPVIIPKIIPKQVTKVEEKPALKKTTIIKVPPKAPPKVPPPRIKPKPKFDKTKDRETREILKQARGLVAWRQGEVDGKDVWHGIKYPYLSSDDFFTLVGRKPVGANIVKGPGSAVKTVVLLYGKPPSRTVQLDMGAMDVKVTPQPTVKFKPDPKQITKGDITIGR